MFFRCACALRVTSPLSTNASSPTSAWTVWSWVSTGPASFTSHGRFTLPVMVSRLNLSPPQGRGSFMASASPLLYSLLETTMRGVTTQQQQQHNTLKSDPPLSERVVLASLTSASSPQVKSPLGSVYDMVGTSNWDAQM